MFTNCHDIVDLRFALIIGINEYESPNISYLEGALLDADANARLPAGAPGRTKSSDNEPPQ